MLRLSRCGSHRPPESSPPAQGGLPSHRTPAAAPGRPARFARLRPALGRAAACLVPACALLAPCPSAAAEDAPALALTRLAVPHPEAERRRLYPPFDPAVHHYALRCGGEDPLTLLLSGVPDGARLTVDGRPVAGRDPQVVLTAPADDRDIVIALRRGDAASAYVVHCLGEDFPDVSATHSPGVSEGLILVSLAMHETPSTVYSWLAMVDNNGVPRFRRRIDGSVFQFKAHDNARYPYSYSRVAGEIESTRGVPVRTFEFVLLDRNLEPQKVVRTVPPLRHTNVHDFVVRENGNYLFIAYEPVRRDLSAFIDEGTGRAYRTAEPTDDSVIQEVTPDGREVLRWNSWDHLALEDCTGHRFPRDYAHLNSLQVMDGDIVASFRGCSQVLRIDGASGEVVWRLGRSNRDWPEPALVVEGDPHGEFCGQHSASVTPAGHVVLFDNGGHCPVDAATGEARRQGGRFSRVVEYALDPEAGAATFVRHHSLHGSFDRYARSRGSVRLLANGNWLVGWGAGRLGADPNEAPLPPDVTLTEVDPRTGEALLALRFSQDGRVLPSHGYRVGLDALAGAAP